MSGLVPTRNTGKANLEKARFFLHMVELTEKVDPFDQTAAETFLAAAIVFGKATQDWMADQFGELEGVVDESARARRKAGKQWLRSTSLWEDPVCKLFADTRDVIVHEDGSVDLDSRTSLTIHVPTATAVLSGRTVIVQVTPTNATPEQLEEAHQQCERDRAEAERQNREREEAVALIIAEHREKAEEYARSHPVERTTRVHFNATDREIAGKPAVDIVRGYLNNLERVLVAERKIRAAE